MVYRIYVEKKPGFDREAQALLTDIRSFLQIGNLSRLRLLNRYDAENMSEATFESCVTGVFSEPQVDDVYRGLPAGADRVFAVEYLPGQYDQRADSAAQCVQLACGCERPDIRTAAVYMLYGALTDGDLLAIRQHVINPVERREASLDPYGTIRAEYPLPEDVQVLKGFTALDSTALKALRLSLNLAMDSADMRCCQDYFRSEKRDPTVTEIRVTDTYWSDHCRHTTFLTELTNVTFEDADVEASYARYLQIRRELGRENPVSLMDLATIGAKCLKARGLLSDVDESDEINACTVKIDVDADGETQKWLLLFKNETHNHPTEIEPFGGAATCIGGAIRDPLSGRAYVYQAMRVTGAADPTRPVTETIPGKLPQRMICAAAAHGYSSYGNQIGLATGLVDEVYHSGYAAKRMEIGAVLGAAPAANVRRETPVFEDVVVLLGGRTGRDGCGGATGSSKSHTASSLKQCGAEVQKGNAPEERKLQRLFRDPEAARLIKRCNDFGAGGVSVAVGELADGLRIDLDAVPRKYDGLDGTELAISESQERLAVVLDKKDEDRFIALARGENLEATRIAVITKEPRMVMRWNSRVIADLSREFLGSNGARRYADAHVARQERYVAASGGTFAGRMRDMAGDLRFCSRRGLAERFDATNGAGSLLMPFGGKRQMTPIQAMACLIPVRGAQTTTCSVMAYGFDPYLSEKSPYHGAYLAVMESVTKLAACGADISHTHLTFQEYFERMGADPAVWGKPVASLLGALDAQLGLGFAAIGGKDSMSGSFENLHVPPTLVSFAVCVSNAKDIVSGELKHAGTLLGLIVPPNGDNGLPDPAGVLGACARVTALLRGGHALAAYALGTGGIAEAVFKMGMGNGIGCRFEPGVTADSLFIPSAGSFVVEYAPGAQADHVIGRTTGEYAFYLGGQSVDGAELEKLYEERLATVYPVRDDTGTPAKPADCAYKTAVVTSPRVRAARPRVLIPVFPGTNCEYDTEKAFVLAGAAPEIMVVRNLTARDVVASAKEFASRIGQSQIIFIPGGFSGGDEPDGSGKFITAFFRNPRISDEVMKLLTLRDGLVGGICNGFQALIKLGLVPFGEIRKPDAVMPTLTFNPIGRHQSRLVRTLIVSNKSPWLMYAQPGELFTAPVSHGEGRFVAGESMLAALCENGQVATRYADGQGNPSMDILYNPNGSVGAVEGLLSPDGRVFGKMAHSERVGKHLYKNVPGNYEIGMFRSAADYFTL
jgi:phosphoribosylformylglycinamidine synthase